MSILGVPITLRLVAEVCVIAATLAVIVLFVSLL